MADTDSGTFSPFGRDLFGSPIVKPAPPLAARFTFPPFSVLDGRSGEWQDRKRAWLAMGIKSELGRDGRCFGQDIMRGEHVMLSDDSTIRSHTCSSDSAVRIAEGYEGSGAGSSGTSIFDPVLCELSYRWFCPPGGQVVDPFAGGSVRGVVAGSLGYRYWGCDLRPEQIAANIEQADSIRPDLAPEWVVGDSLDTLQFAPDADLLFTCPPYGDLERYSDDPRDISTMEYHTFRAAYARILLRAVSRLKEDRFACLVVGDFRDKKTGHYRGFHSDTISMFQQLGMHLYNDAVILNAIGSLPVRVGKQFTSGRKLGKAHQNLLVFVKGDWRRAAMACA